MNNNTRKLICGNYEIIVNPDTVVEVYTYPSAQELSNAYNLLHGITDRPFPYVSKYLCTLVIDFLNRNKKVAAIGLGFESVYTYSSCDAYTFLSRNQYVKSTGKKVNCDLICNYSGNNHNWSNRYLKIQEDIIPLLKFCKSEAEKRRKEIASKNRKIRDKNAAIDLQRRSSAIGKFFAPSKREYINEANDEFIKIIQEINDLQEKLSKEIYRINQERARFERKQAWIQKYYGQAFLIVQNGTKYQLFFEKECNFSIANAKNEIRNAVIELQAEKKRAENSMNSGERAVEYALKWFSAGCSNHIVAIKNNCSSSYRNNCILLSNPEFIDEPQEYDHILAGPFGVAIIETKHWKGKIVITSEGKWLRYSDNSSEPIGVANPKTQMKRHEVLLQSIIPNVPIYSILCFSNDTARVEGTSNFTEYSLVRLDQLAEALSKLLENNKYSNAEVDKIVQLIEQHKVNTSAEPEDTPPEYINGYVEENTKNCGIIKCNKEINPNNAKGEWVIEGTVTSGTVKLLDFCQVEDRSEKYHVRLIQLITNNQNIREASEGQEVRFALRRIR